MRKMVKNREKCGHLSYKYLRLVHAKTGEKCNSNFMKS